MNGFCSREIERGVIGELLLEPGILKKSGIQEEDFSPGLPYMRIFRAMDKLFREKRTFDLTMLADEVNGDDLVVLNEAANQAFTTQNFTFHLSSLRELSLKRKLHRVLLEADSKIDDGTAEETALKVKASISQILIGQDVNSITGAEMAKHGWAAIEDRAKRCGTLSGIPMGIKTLDSHLDGFQNSELTLIAARPSVGKSAFSLHCLLSAAGAGIPGGFLSLEMAQMQIEQRLLANISGVPMWAIRKGIMRPEEWEKITPAADVLTKLPIRFVFGVRRLGDVVSSMIRLVENDGVRILFLDYIQLVKAEAQNREREIGIISGELKAAAASMGVPIVALSQLSRAPERREDRRPNLADLRDSGTLEQDADNVLMLFREDNSAPKGEVEFHLAKARNAGGGKFKAFFDGEVQRYFDLEERREK